MEPFWIIVKAYECDGRRVYESQQRGTPFDSFDDACKKAKKSSECYHGEFFVMAPVAVLVNGQNHKLPNGAEKMPVDLYKQYVYAGESGEPEVFVDGHWVRLIDCVVHHLHAKENTGSGVGGDRLTGPFGGVAGGGVWDGMAAEKKAAARDGKTRVTHGFIRDYHSRKALAKRRE